jgi:VanZ family protein
LLRWACTDGFSLDEHLTSTVGNLRVALAAIVAMIVYGSLYPFAFHWVGDGIGPLHTLLYSWDKTPGRGDFISNILLYMPLGFIGTVTVGKRIGISQLALTILIGIALSFTMEVLQYYDTGRDTEATDLYANTLGTAIGAGIGWFFGQDFRLPLLREISVNRVPALLLTAWLGYRLYPYVPTIDLHKYWNALKPVFLYPQLTPDSLFRHVAVWLSICVMIEKIAGDRGASGLIGRFAAFLIFSSVLVISTRVTAAQIAGIVVAFAIWRILPTWRARVVIAAATMGIYVVVFRLDPFVFSDSSGPYSWMPFLSFMQGSIDIDVESFFEKFFLYGGLIWLLAEAGMATRLATLLVAAIVLGASFAEVFIPGRSAEITDAILALATGEFIRALEVGAVDRARYRSMFRRGVAQPDTLTRRLIVVEEIDAFVEVAE